MYRVDNSTVKFKDIDNSPTDEEFAALPHIIENMNKEPREKVNVRIRYTDKDGNRSEERRVGKEC